MLFQFCDTPLFSLLPNSPTLQLTCFISDRYCMPGLTGSSTFKFNLSSINKKQNDK